MLEHRLVLFHGEGRGRRWRAPRPLAPGKRAEQQLVLHHRLRGVAHEASRRGQARRVQAPAHNLLLALEAPLRRHLLVLVSAAFSAKPDW